MRHRHFILLPCLAVLSACGGETVKDTLGLNREAPDEFRVVSRPPLSVPPQFNLRPPAGPGEAVTTQAADKQAEALLLGTSGRADGNLFTLQPGTAETAVQPVAAEPLNKSKRDTPETNFLERAGATGADPSIRQALEQDRTTATQPPEEEEDWWDVLSTMPPKKDPMVDAKKEAERIRQNKDGDKPITEGETPEVKGRDTGILGRILDY